MTSSARLATDSHCDADVASGFDVGRNFGRQRIGGKWVDRQPPGHLFGARWYNWMLGYRQGLRERAIDSGEMPYRAGQWAFLNGLWRSENPYPRGSEEYEEWLSGWLYTRRLKVALEVLAKATP